MDGLARHGSYLPIHEVQALVATMDTTGSGRLDYEEFLAATVHFSKTMSEEILFEAFAELDADGTGFITAGDIAAKLTQLGTVEVSEAEVLRMIQEADLNDDGMARPPGHTDGRPKYPLGLSAAPWLTQSRGVPCLSARAPLADRLPGVHPPHGSGCGAADMMHRRRGASSAAATV